MPVPGSKDHLNNSNIPIYAKKVIKEKGYSVKVDKNDKHRGKYTKRKFLNVTDSYSAFENLFQVRRYIQERYDITMSMLEILLYLHPKNYFTFYDISIIGITRTYWSINHFTDTGLIRTVTKSNGKHNHLYTLSRQGKMIVQMFYECLSGERKIPENPSVNKLAKAERLMPARKTFMLIQEMNKMEIPESKKKLI